MTLTAQIQPPQVETATDEAIANYLRYSCQIAEIAAKTEEDALIVKACQELGLTVPDGELQAAGDAFRMQYKLLGASETLAWLAKQRITPEDWTQGIRIKLLTQKLKEHLFLDTIDAHYLANREEYRRVALSQIVVSELSQALEIVQKLRQENASFVAMALEHSQAQLSAKNGGFVGIRFLSTLIPEIREAIAPRCASGTIANASEGDIINPLQTHLGYHILRIEKWFPPSLNESVRAEIMEDLWRNWLINNSHQ
uniref:peptidylprolyl isomerase n=1 Tax=Synechocystis sp. PCC 9413 TaxID=77760 RepID=A0A2P0ZGJ1_9SYNC|nr:PpiC-type peptidyl-prolyl cis-transl isomerase [Synechocystis sp. PCC 9413]